MKYIYITVAFSLFCFLASGQSQRMVLHEEFTNASCPPCAAQNPSYNALLDANEDIGVSIKYQTAFPGFDPMNQHNPGEVNTRLNYYPGVTGVPTGIIDGEIPDVSPSYAGAPGAFTQSMMEDAADVPASFDIEIDYTVSYSELVVNATATCTQAASGDLKFRIAVVEREIIFDSPPGSTNEFEFYNVMKKMLPSAAGQTMESAYAVGEEYSTTQSWNLANVYDLEELAVIVFVQNDDNKEVLQAAMADQAEFVADSETDAALVEISDASGENCPASVTPSVLLRNFGSETLTSVDIEYAIAGVSNTVNWTGSLEFFETELVELGEIETPTEQDEDLVVTLSNPNGVADENGVNDEVEVTITAVPEVGAEIEVVIETDNYGEETYWRVVDGANNVLGEGGNTWVGTTNIGVGGGAPTEGAGTYASNQTYETTVSIPAGVDCYNFEIYDYWGDGICCQYGNGSYEVIDLASSQTILQGGSFSAEEAKNFSGGVLSIADVSSVNDFALFPNPTNGLLNIEFNLVSSQHVTIDVLDLTGRLVISKDLGILPAGYSLQRVDLIGHSEGLYLLNMNVNNDRVVGKFTINN